MKQIPVPFSVCALRQLPALFFCLLILCFPGVPIAQPRWEATADRMLRYEDPPMLIAEGNVVLQKRDKQPLADAGHDNSETVAEDGEGQILTTIRADSVIFDITRNQVKARGNILIDIGDERLAARSGHLNLQDATGYFEDAVIVRQSKDIRLEGRAIRKTGERTYQIEDGWVVTCKLEEGETPPWSFAAADTEITDGGYAFLKHATFRIKDVPVLYLPVMVLPAKHERQTGFLMPLFSTSSRDGFSVETPFFIDLSPSADLTLFPRYFDERGFMMGIEGRYVLSDTSKGIFRGHFLDDNLSPSDGRNLESRYSHTNSDRYWLRGKVDQDIGSWVTRLDVDVVSDRDYLREFSSGSTDFSDNNELFLDAFGRGFVGKTYLYRDNTLAALRTWDNGMSFQADFLAVNDISKKNYTADDPSQAWKLPSFNFAGLLPIFDPKTLDTNFAWNANYTHFWREKGVRGQRLDLMPSLQAAVPINSYLEASVGGGIRDILYLLDDNGATDWQNEDTENRFLYNFNAEIATTLMRDFDLRAGDTTGLNHLMRPFISYEYQEIPDKKLLPDFDDVDDIEDENAIYYGISNFFTTQGERNGRTFERDLAFVKIKQGYDLRSEKNDRPLTPVRLESGFYPLEGLRLMYKTRVDMYGEGAYYHAVDGSYHNDRGDKISIDYRYDEENDINSVSGKLWCHLPGNLIAGYSLERAIKQDETIEERFRLVFHQPCWAMELAYDSTPGDETFMVFFHLANIGSAFGSKASGGI